MIQSRNYRETHASKRKLFIEIYFGHWMDIIEFVVTYLELAKANDKENETSDLYYRY